MSGQPSKPSASRWRLIVPVVALAVLLILLSLVLVFEQSPGRLAVEVGVLLAAYAVWSVGTGNLVLRALDVRDANIELGAIQAAYLVILFALLLVVLGFLNLFGVLPWK